MDNILFYLKKKDKWKLNYVWNAGNAFREEVIRNFVVIIVATHTIIR